MKNVKVLFVFLLLITENISAQSWQPCSHLPETMVPAVVTVNGKIYAVRNDGSMPNVSSAMYEYNPVNDTWLRKGRMNTKRNGFELIEVNGRIFAIGGSTNQNVTSAAVEEYNISTGTWITRSSMKLPRSWVGSAKANGKIYIAGGLFRTIINNQPHDSTCNVLEEYNPENDTWKIITPMQKKRSMFGIAAINNRIYAIGGADSKNGYNVDMFSVKNIEEYNIQTDSWIINSSLLENISNEFICAAEAINEKVYVLFTEDPNSPSMKTHIKEFDPIAKSWTTNSSNLVPMFDYSKIVVDNKLYLIGGRLGSDTLSTNFIKYDPVSNTQTYLPDLSGPLTGAGTAVVDGKIYIVGGYDSTFSNKVECYDTKNQVEVKSSINKPTEFSLSQNYPNPFNPETMIGYHLPVISHVKLKVYDMLGREIATLVNKEQKAGSYEVKFPAGFFGDSNNLKTGIYFYRLITEDFILTKKMVLMR